MRIPLSWLRQHTNVPAGDDARTVATTLASVGLEEEGWEPADVTGPLVVGLVRSAVPEPQTNGRTIRWCQVQVGPEETPDSVHGIVCGAPVDAGDLVVVALPDAVLPGGFAISARRTYGHVSDGMICSERELGVGDHHTGIIVLADVGLSGAPGDDAIALLGLDDEVVDVNVTPDRGYCLSVRGIAREYALATRTPFTDPAAVGDVAELAAAARTGLGWPVRVHDPEPLRAVPGCDRYVARLVRGVDAAAPSPYWLRRRLHQSGMRPISLAVDVTNYVMLLTGQPLHAFDAATLRDRIVVRRARSGEKLTTLDDVERTLHPEDLLITDTGDGGDRVLAIAGLMGGAETEVTDDTRDVLIEAAHFAAVSVGRSARRHRLVTEAGRRFERGTDPQLPPHAAELAVRLLVDLGGGTADPAGTDLDTTPGPTHVALPADLPSRLVGADYPTATVIEVLEGIGAKVTGTIAGSEKGRLDVTVPSWRPDLTRPVDLVEEVARVRGYAAVPSVLPSAPAGRGFTRAQSARTLLGTALAARGWVEAFGAPFVAPDVFDRFGLPADDPRRRAMRVANPLSTEQPLLRTSILQTLLLTLRRNVGRGLRDLALFEVGQVVRPGADQPHAPVFPLAQRPADADLQQMFAAVPAQPLRIAGALTGARRPAGWWSPDRGTDWSDAIDFVRVVAEVLHVEVVVSADPDHRPWHPGRCAAITLTDGTLVGHAGELHPAVVSALELPARTVAAEADLDVLIAAARAFVAAAPVSTFPLAYQDVALVVAADVPAAAVERALRDGAGELLESLVCFDVYAGEPLPAGSKSLAYRLTFRAPDRTLTTEEVTAARHAAVAIAAERVGAVLRE